MPDDRAGLLALARAALVAHLAGERRPATGAGAPAPGGPVPQGAFVTLMAGDDLRGCVGRVRADRPLAEIVCELAVAAAREDDRFTPVSREELPLVRIEISVLSEPELLDPVVVERIAIGRDGLLVRRGATAGLLLPQVAPEHGWGPEVFLAATCRKAGLAPDAWRDPRTEVFVFQAQVFGEGG